MSIVSDMCNISYYLSMLFAHLIYKITKIKDGTKQAVLIANKTSILFKAHYSGIVDSGLIDKLQDDIEKSCKLNMFHLRVGDADWTWYMIYVPAAS